MTKPNILFLFSDQHAQKVSGAYGDTCVKTLNIDRLANEGICFDNAYCPSPICVPSRMSTLTARYPYRQHCWTNDDMLRSDLPTWLHVAGVMGYDPVLIGRLHAIGPDQLHGYVHRTVGDHSPNNPGAIRQSMGVLKGANDPNPESIIQSGSGMCAYQIKDTCVTDATVKYLHSTGLDKINAGQNFCLTVGFMLPHAPYVVDKEVYNTYANKVPPPSLDSSCLVGDWYKWWRECRDIQDVSESQSDRVRTAYWGMVQRMDENIGQIISALEDIGALDNTLIIYASDHGDHLGERGLWWKHTFFEESVKIPLIMRLPNILPSGERRQQVVNLVDLSQTILEAMGADCLPYADGRSFWSVAKNASADWKNETFSEYCTDSVPTWTGGRAVQQRMIRSEQWKLCVFDNEAPLLFNLDNDPKELKNLADTSEYADIVQKLMNRLTYDWQPEAIAECMYKRRIEKDIFANWTRECQPEERYIWHFSPSINRLNNET